MTEENEIWVQLYDFTKYEVSNFGKIRSCFGEKPKEKTLRTNKVGPLLFTEVNGTNKEGEKFRKTIFIHRAVADHFVKKSRYLKDFEKNGGLLHATHIVKDYSNNRYDNVKFITHGKLIRSQPNRKIDPDKSWRTRRQKYGNITGSALPPKHNKNDETD